MVNSYYGSTKVEKIFSGINEIKKKTPSEKYFKRIGFFFYLSLKFAKEFFFFGQNDVLSVSNIDYLCVVCM